MYIYIYIYVESYRYVYIYICICKYIYKYIFTWSRRHRHPGAGRLPGITARPPAQKLAGNGAGPPLGADQQLRPVRRVLSAAAGGTRRQAPRRAV